MKTQKFAPLLVLFVCLQKVCSTPQFEWNPATDLNSNSAGFDPLAVEAFTASVTHLRIKAADWSFNAQSILPLEDGAYEPPGGLTGTAREEAIMKEWWRRNSGAKRLKETWLPTVAHCRTLCGESVKRKDGSVWQLGRCETAVLDMIRTYLKNVNDNLDDLARLRLDGPPAEYEDWVREQDSGTTTKEYYDALIKAKRNSWLSEMKLKYPIYWTMGGGIRPIYVPQGFCSCRPGWGMDKETEDYIYHASFGSPHGNWSETTYDGVSGSMPYTGEGRFLMSTMITWDRYYKISPTQANFISVVAGWKLPMHCGHKVNTDVGNGVLNPANAGGDTGVLLDELGLMCGPFSLGRVDPLKKCAKELALVPDLISDKQISSHAGSQLREFARDACSSEVLDANVMGYCNCKAGYGDSFENIEGPRYWRELVRPFSVDTLFPVADRAAARATYFQPEECEGLGLSYCIASLRLGESPPTIYMSPRCQDFRQCLVQRGPVLNKPPYTVGVTVGYSYTLPSMTNVFDTFTQPDSKAGFVDMFPPVVYKQRSCGKYYCTSTQRGTFAVDPNGVYSCNCFPRYYGDNCEIDGNQANCNNHGEYDQTTGLCTCTGDWITVGSPTPFSVNQCDTLCGDENCNGNGRCNAGDLTCVCDAGHAAPDCSETCRTAECNGQGNCTYPFVSCTCEVGFTGTRCHINDRYERCSDHGEPIDLGTYPDAEDACVCDPGYAGVDCSIYIPPDDDGCEIDYGDARYDNTHASHSTVHSGNKRYVFTDDDRSLTRL
jgi:hypothetical protein